MDVDLVEKIVHEVKSQGVFDEFRKDSMADVDTKPAYQNLRQRVENTVKKFLSEQKWSLETNKNQLREKLRRHITESGFLDVGVERIVDQVVNPKIGSVFQPRIEEIAYKYLGLPLPPKKFEPPPPPLMHPLPPLPLNAPPLKVETSSLLPTDLEQVSPDSDNATVKSEGKLDMDVEEKLVEDEDESPPFEPLVKQEIEISNDGLKLQNQEQMNIKPDNDTSSIGKANELEENRGEDYVSEQVTASNNNSQEVSYFVPESVEVEKEVSQSVDARISQDSQLSSVSSDSRLSVNIKDDSLQSSSQEAVAANISEEAQMPKFSENSCEQTATDSSAFEKVSSKSALHFDIKKDEIKFEGTERKMGIESLESSAVKTEEERYLSIKEIHSSEAKNDSFKFSTTKLSAEVKDEDCDITPNAQELSFGSSIEDTISPTQTPKDPTNNKEKYESSNIQTPKQTACSITPKPSPTTPPLPSHIATHSSASSYKPDKDHHSKYYSSSSKHKKHSKERRRSYEREKEKDSGERHRYSKETKDSYKYHSRSGSKNRHKHSSSSSSSKYYSSHNKTTEKDMDKSSSSAHYSSKYSKHSHSHSSSSSNEHQESRKPKRDSNRRHHSSSSLSSRRNEKKDDHAEAKHKIQRRKSTDSNDDEGDKSIGGGKSVSQYKSSNSTSVAKSTKSGSSENNKSSTSKSNDDRKDQIDTEEFAEECTEKFQFMNKVVILNEMLENPQTQFIQLNSKGHLVEIPLQQQPISDEADVKKSASNEFNNNSIEHFSFEKEKKIEEKESSCADLLYFEEIPINFTQRLKLLNTTMDLCRSAVNSLRFDSLCDEGIELSNEEDVNSDNSKINLLTETLKRKSDFNYKDFETTPRKRFNSNESEECSSKTSPTLSDTSSVNSKENQEIPKNMT